LQSALASKVEGWIASALEGSGWSVSEILEGVARGDFFLFLHPEGCMVAEFIQSPRMKAMHVFAAGGTMEAVRALLPQVEAFGRENGCDRGGATGRKGWARVLRQYGYEPALGSVGKEL
jgi:hypothetical protein